MRPSVLRLLALLGIGLLAACSSTTLSGSWSSPEFHGEIRTVYIVGMSRPETGRRILEDAFARELAAYGINGLASYRDLPEVTEQSKPAIAAQVASRRADAVLVTRVTGRRTEEFVTPGRVTAYPYGPYYSRYGYYRPYPYYRSWASYYDRSYDLVYTPPTVSRYDVISLEATLYATGTEELIWSAQLETVVEGSLERMAADFVSTVTRDLAEHGLI